MSRHYIIDGYNALHATDRWADVPRDRQREAFLKFLDETRLTGSARNTVTVVLDGYAESLRKLPLASLRLVFSGDEDADTVIKRRVADLANPRDAVVVTNDRGIAVAVRASGAQVLACEEFFQLEKTKKPVARKSDKPDPAAAESINDELKRLWKLD